MLRITRRIRETPTGGLFAGGAFEARAVENADLFAADGDNAGGAQFAEGGGGGFAIDGEVLGKFAVGKPADGVAFGSFQQQSGHARDETAEGSGLEVLEHVDKALADQLQETARDGGTLLQEGFEITSRNGANA